MKNYPCCSYLSFLSLLRWNINCSGVTKPKRFLSFGVLVIRYRYTTKTVAIEVQESENKKCGPCLANDILPLVMASLYC